MASKSKVSGRGAKRVPSGTLPKKSVRFNCAEEKTEKKALVALPEPKKILFPRDKIKRGWGIDVTIGCGLINLGNTCFMNAVLQVLFHTPAFFNWLVDEITNKKHKRKCESKGLVDQCCLCPMTSAVLGVYNKDLAPMKPTMIQLNTIGKHFDDGRQHDAHEFLRLLMESMERSYLAAIGGHGLDHRSKQTTPLGQIFGGYMRVEVCCLTCRHISTTFQQLAELQLDIREASNVQEAIGSYFEEERLNESNGYRCERCETAQLVTKQQFLELAPLVLCIQLKRFRPYGSKMDKKVFVNERLNLSRFMYDQSHHDPLQTAEYKLVGLVTHKGRSARSGHYTATAQASNGNFYHFDDADVRQVYLDDVQNASAYVILYEMVDPSLL